MDVREKIRRTKRSGKMKRDRGYDRMAEKDQVNEVRCTLSKCYHSVLHKYILTPILLLDYS